VACRQEAGKAGLLRLVKSADGAGVRSDPTGRAPGRGAYLHPRPECLELARRRRSLERALGAPAGERLWSELAATFEIRTNGA
jgi:predicted RNA-binding protein YlxR (DUF448 family)